MKITIFQEDPQLPVRYIHVFYEDITFQDKSQLLQSYKNLQSQISNSKKKNKKKEEKEKEDKPNNKIVMCCGKIVHIFNYLPPK